MSLTAFLQKVVEILDESAVPYMLTGSLAVVYYAVPRATQDIDIVIETEERGVERLVQGLLAVGWYVDRHAALQAWRRRGQFNAIEPESGWKADFIVRKDRPYSRIEFERRARISLLGVELAIASLEDVLIAKLEWGRLGDSALHRRDVAQLVERRRADLDQVYLEKWIHQLGLEAEWNRIQARVNEPPTSDEAE